MFPIFGCLGFLVPAIVVQAYVSTVGDLDPKKKGLTTTAVLVKADFILVWMGVLALNVHACHIPPSLRVVLAGGGDTLRLQKSTT